MMTVAENSIAKNPEGFASNTKNIAKNTKIIEKHAENIWKKIFQGIQKFFSEN